jgi:hypothetical protein
MTLEKRAYTIVHEDCAVEGVSRPTGTAFAASVLL